MNQDSTNQQNASDGQRRFKFACKYVFPITALFLTWGFSVNLYQTNLNQTQLIRNEGVVNGIGIVFEQGTSYGNKYYPLEIILAGLQRPFRLRDSFKNLFPNLQKDIIVGDTIEIYTRSEFLSIIGWGEKNDIYLIKKDNKILLPLSVMSDYNGNQAIVLLILAIIFWIPFILYKLKVFKLQSQV